MTQQLPESRPSDQKAPQRDAARRLLDLGQLSTDHLSEVLANRMRRKRRRARLIVICLATIAALLLVGVATYQVMPGRAALFSK
jgi:hypothetical protein